MKEIVGSYRIVAPLGHGGMGIVYLGIHDQLGREVAIKVLAPELTKQPEFRDRFFAEARNQARLQHTNIVSVYDLLEENDEFFIVMEHVHGSTLEASLAEGLVKVWSIDRCVHVFGQILMGLDFAHSKGVIHRDVKPSNVLVGERELVKLTDFGIALLMGDKRLTVSRSVVGTPAYMSPEQILRPRAVDHRTDIYSAAIVLFEMLSGHPPFEAETEYETKKLQIEKPCPDIRELNPDVGEYMAVALATALKKNPDERFASAGTFLRFLQHEASTVHILAETTQDSLLSSARKAGGRDDSLSERPHSLGAKMGLALTAITVATLVVGLFVLAYYWRLSGGDKKSRVHSTKPSTAYTGTPAVAVGFGKAKPSNQSPVAKPGEGLASSVPKIPSDSDSVKLQVLRADIRERTQKVRTKIDGKDFDGAQQEIAELLPIIKGKRDLKRESHRVAELQSLLGDAIARQAEKERPQSLEGKREPEREAPKESDSPGALSAIPAQSQEFVDKPKELEAEAINPCKVKLTRAEMPAMVKKGSKFTAILHVTINPPARQIMALRVSIRIMQNSKPIGDEIQGTIRVLPGRDGLEIRAPIRAPWWRTPAGDYYLEVKFSDSTGVMHSVGRIGFRME